MTQKDNTIQPSEEPRWFDEPKRLSRSKLWDLLRNYYNDQGMEAWRRQLVPHFITSNSFTARAFAKQVLGFLRDLAADGIDETQPVYMVELGAGSGRFAFHFLTALTDLLNHSSLSGVKFRYVLSDFAEANISYWREHPQLAPLAKSGILDVSFFDVERDESLRLKIRDEEIRPGDLANPLVVFANYVFDTLPHDAFRVQRGQLEECQAGLLGATEDLVDILGALEIEYRYRPIEGPYYDDPIVQALLDHYRHTMDDSHVSIPTVAMACVRRLASLAEGQGLLLISADKGYSDPGILAHLGLPGMAKHGSVSFSVNYHALGWLAQRLGGEALFPQNRQRLLVSTFLLGRDGKAHPETRLSYREALSGFGPDVFFTLQQRLVKEIDKLRFAELIALLQTSYWDAQVFSRCMPRLRELLREGLTASEESELYDAVARVWAGYFFLGEEYDLAFDLGMILKTLSCYPEAIGYFEKSLELWGERGITCFNMGMSHRGMWQREKALECFKRAALLDPASEETRAMQQRTEAALERSARFGKTT